MIAREPSEPYAGAAREKHIVDQFHKLYYDAAHAAGTTWTNTFWLGVRTSKCPLDLWVYQEILFEVRPDVIVECGTEWRGSALFLASMCDLIGKGRIITIDIEHKDCRPKHERIAYLLGSSTSTEIVTSVRALTTDSDRIMVVLDSNHRRDHVLRELRIYGEFVSKGSYIIVEDTNLNGHPVVPNFGPGPMEAVEEFLRERNDFVTDNSRENHYLTFNPKGYLQRVG